MSSAAVADRGPVADVFPLTPAQEAMLFETLAAPGSGAYVQQFVYRLTGPLDGAALRAAWQSAVDRHPLLRAAFAWRGRARPLHVVLRRVGVPWQERDLRGLGHDEVRRRLESHLHAVAREGLPLERAPQVRLGLWRTGDHDHLLLVANHHLVLDAWSRSRLMSEVVQDYSQRVAGDATPRPGTVPDGGFRSYVAALARCDPGDGRDHFRRLLQGVHAGSRASGILDPRPGEEGRLAAAVPRRAVLRLPAGPLADRAAQDEVTLASVFTAGWLLALARLSGRADVVTGTTVSGRALPEGPLRQLLATGVDLECLIGPTVGTLPVRARVPVAGGAGPWLREVHHQLTELRRHEHVPLARIHGWSAVPRTAALVESIVDFQQFYAVDSLEQPGDGLRVELLEGRERLAVPLAVAGHRAGTDVVVRLDADPERVPHHVLEEVAAVFRGALADVARGVLPPPGGPGDGARRRTASPGEGTGEPGHRTRPPDPVLAPLAAELERRARRLVGERRDEAADRALESEHERWWARPRVGPPGPAAPPAWWVGPPAPEPDQSLHDLVRSRAVGSPQAVAVRSGDAELTYGDLVSRASRVAAALRSRGVAGETLVAVCLPRCPDLVVALLGVLAAGGVYLPVDPAAPRARSDLVLEDARPAVVLASREHAERFRDLAPVLVVEDVLADAAPAGPATTAWTSGDSCGLAYVLFTSGSTGRPKGVAVEHRSVAGFVRRIGEDYDIGPGTRVLAFAPVTFDVSVFDVFATLANGGTVVLAGDRERRSATALQRLLQGERVAVAEIPPAVLPLLDPTTLPHLRLVSVGGEAPAGALVERWSGPGRRFVNGYGPTETTVAVTLMDCRGRWGVPPPIGRPMANHRTYVVAEGMRPCAVREPGELCVAGTGVARGYLGDPAATADRFVPDPWSPVPGARMYRTGDRVRWLPDGTLEFLGRTDRQLSVRGFRVEAGEVEHLARRHPDVDEAVVDVVGDGAHGRLVAWVTGPGAVDEGALRAHLSDVLPSYMVPSVVRRVADLPRTPEGKVDRSRLPDPDEHSRRVAGDGPGPAAVGAPEAGPPVGAAAGSPVTWERIAREVLAPLLGSPVEGPDDDFFALGGNSLQAMQVTSRVRDVFGVEVDLVGFFESPTPRHVAQLVAARTGAALPPAEDAPAPEAGTPLAPVQERLWRTSVEHPDTTVFHAPLALRIRGPLEPAALSDAFARLVDRHLPLRARVEVRDGVPVFADVDGPVVDWRFEDFAGLAPPDRVPAAQRLLREATTEPFDVGRGPLVRVRVLRLAPDDHVVQWVIHHLMTDAWSLGVQLRELAAGYRPGGTAGEDPGEDPAEDAGEDMPRDRSAPPVSYADYVREERAWLAGADARREEDWWRSRLRGAPVLTPVAARRDTGGPASVDGMNVALGPQLGPAVEALARRCGVTLYSVLLSAVAATVGHRGGTDDVLVLTPVAGRTRTRWEALVGFFVNRVVVRVDLGGDPRGAELVRRVHGSSAEAFAHQRLPFDHLHELLRSGADRGPALGVLFSVQNTPQGSSGFSGMTSMEPMPDGSGRDFNPVLELYSPPGETPDLGIVLRQRPEGIAGGLEFDTRALERSAAADLWAAVTLFLERLTIDPGARLSDLSREPAARPAGGSGGPR
ncbi:MAG: amino acid adenylation domain-containing protein [Kineosporiaceae bacterium]